MEQKYTITLQGKKEVAKDTMQFFFSLPEGFVYKSGQSIDLTLINPSETDPEGNTRSFSIVTAPFEDHLSITTRLRDTAFKRVLRNLPEGTEIEMVGPFGSFTLHNTSTTPAVFLTGGIGITPVMSMIKNATHEHLPHKLVLLYANHTKEDTAFFDEFTAFQKENPNFTFVPIMTQADASWTGEKDHISKEMLAKYLPDIHAPIYYLCGPMGMVQTLRKTLVDAGINEDNIRTEDFPGY